MVDMRYYTADLLTNAIIAELPLYGVYMDKILNGAGNFTGTFVLDSGVELDDILLAGSIPGQQALFVERNDVCIWAGPVWSRTYQSTSRTAQLTAQTFESVFEHIVMTTDQIYAAVEQVTILSTWLSAMMAQTNNNFGITGSFPGATGITRTLSYLAAEYKHANELLQAIATANDGLDYTINVASPTSKTMVVKKQGTAGSSGAVYDYPGQIANYWHSESGAKGAVRAAAIGAGVSGNATIGSPSLKPYFWQVGQYSDIADQNAINAKASELLQMPFVSPTFELATGDDFDGWDKLGQTFITNIDDARFPTGKTITSRLMGWALTPEQSEAEENLKFVLETDV